MASGWSVRRALGGVDMDVGDRALQGPLGAPAPAGRGAGRRDCRGDRRSVDDPEATLEKKDKGAILRKCLTGLSADHREIIDLVYYHEKSVEEVAEIVGIPENTVKTRMFYARKTTGGAAQGGRN